MLLISNSSLILGICGGGGLVEVGRAGNRSKRLNRLTDTGAIIAAGPLGLLVAVLDLLLRNDVLLRSRLVCRCLARRGVMVT